MLERPLRARRSGPAYLAILVLLAGCDSAQSMKPVAHPQMARESDARKAAPELGCTLPPKLSGPAGAEASALSRHFSGCREILRDSLGPEFSGIKEDGLKAVWASLAAHAYRPYGDSMAFTLDELLQEKTLDCDNYAMLTWHLFHRLAPQSHIRVRMVGWDRGPVGNHAQIFVENAGVPLLLDPTVGLVANAGFDEVAAGRPIPAERVRIWEGWTDLSTTRFRIKVARAIISGRYRPSHILYWFASPENFPVSLTPSRDWPTPQFQTRRERPNDLSQQGRHTIMRKRLSNFRR